MRHLEGLPHHVDVARAVEGVVVAPLVAVHQLLAGALAALHASGGAQALGQLELVFIEVDADNVFCTSYFGRLKFVNS